MTEDFPRVVAAVEAGIEAGLHIGAVVHVLRDGLVAADFALGAASLGTWSALRVDHKLLWLSAGKPLTAMAVAVLADRGRLAFDDPVVKFMPEFGQNGKDNITLWHLLTHTHAYKPPLTDWPRAAREDVITKICAAAPMPGTRPGEYAAYDPQSGWYLLSDVVRLVSGRTNAEFVHQEILEPAALEPASIGESHEAWQRDVAEGRLAVLHDTTGSAREGIDLRGAAAGDENALADTDHVHHPRPWVGDDAQRAAAHNPGGGALGQASVLARFYQFILDGTRLPDGTSLLRQETLQQMTSRQREGLKDNSFGQVIDWGLGFLINSARYGSPALPYGYGSHASDSTFGHGGMQSSAGFADPENEVAGAIIFNGLPGEPKHQKRINQVMTALYEDLGITR